MVGELRQGKLYGDQLEEWTEGVEAKVVPLLKQAIASADERVAEFREVLENIGRGSVAAEVYRSSVHERIDAAWQSFSAAQDTSTGAALSTWVERFFATVVANAQQDMSWCGKLLPSPSPTVRGAVAEALAMLSPSFAERTTDCLKPLDAKEGTDTFCTLHAAALQFAEDLESACQPTDACAEYLDDSELAALFRNFVTLQKDYTQREAQRFGRACKDATEGLKSVDGRSAEALRARLVPVSDGTFACDLHINQQQQPGADATRVSRNGTGTRRAVRCQHGCGRTMRTRVRRGRNGNVAPQSGRWIRDILRSCSKFCRAVQARRPRRRLRTASSGGRVHDAVQHDQRSDKNKAAGAPHAASPFLNGY